MKILTAFLIATLTASAYAQQAPQPAAKPTPRTADGHPDLSGVWNAGNPSIRKDQSSIKILLPLEGVDQNKDNVFAALDRISVAERAKAANKPPYKPELASKVQMLSDKRQFNDPSFYCKPLGVPRMGPPSQVVQTPGLVVLLYQGRNTFRTIPTDGRPHNEDADWTWMGDPVGRWDGDTLVIDTTKLVEDSWLGADGWFHSPKMHVVERLSRKGDTLTWSATVEDPVVFTKPWNMTPRTVRLNTKPKALLEEDPPCLEQDGPHIVTDDHH